MARMKGLLQFTGSIDSFVMYKLNGKLIVRRKPNVSLHRRRNSPGYAGTRRHQGEFSHLSKAGKLFRQGLGGLYRTCCDAYAYQRITKLMSQIKDLDNVSGRGERIVANGLAHPDTMNLFHHFSFDNQQSAYKQMYQKPMVDFEKRSIGFSGADAGKLFNWPKKANKMTVQAHFLMVDFAGNETEMHSSKAYTCYASKAKGAIPELLVTDSYKLQQGKLFALLEVTFIKDDEGVSYVQNKGGQPLLTVLAVK